MHDGIIAVPVVLMLFAGIVALEVLLAKKGKKPGLVLPFAFLGISVAVFAGMLVIKAIASTMVQNYMVSEEGALIAPEPSGFLGIGSRDLVEALLWFLICNVFTAILFAMYAICRHVQRRRQALVQMRMQDL